MAIPNRKYSYFTSTRTKTKLNQTSETILHTTGSDGCWFCCRQLMSGLDKLRLVSGVLASTDKVVDMPADDTAAASLSHSSQE